MWLVSRCPRMALSWIRLEGMRYKIARFRTSIGTAYPMVSELTVSVKEGARAREAVCGGSAPHGSVGGDGSDRDG